MLSKVSITILRRFLCFHCLAMLIICLNPKVIIISTLFRILDSLNHIQLPLFMLSNVSIAIIRRFLCFPCLIKHIMCLNHYVIIISILFRILDSVKYSVTSVHFK